MKKELKNIKINKKYQIFSVFVFFTTILWFLNALNQEYTTDINVPVNFYNLPPNKANIAELPNKLTVTVKAFGYNIFKYQLKKNFVPLRINLAEIQFNTVNNDTNKYYILTNEYKNYIEKELNDKLTVEILKPDTIHFQFTTFAKKKVPVILNAKISPKEQYFLTDNIIIKPDSVVIGGPAIIIDTINYVHTNYFEISDLSDTMFYQISPESIDKIVITPPKVNITINVEEYTELNFSIPIKTINVPDSVNLLLFPNHVNIVCKVSVKDYDNVQASDFEVIVDYMSIIDNLGTQLATQVVSYPDKVFSHYQTPEFVEYIVEKK